ncbi:MAG: YceI family protein, partial [Gemmatimonadaceae bacterium]
MRHTLPLHARAIGLGATLAAAPLGAQTPALFHLDRPHSSIGFTVRFMGLSTVRGQFTDFRGAMLYREPDVTASSVTVVIQTASIHTGGGFRDRHLRSPDFFDAEKYPVILFQSRSIEKTNGGFIARGPLTIHGVTKDVAIPFVQTHGRMKDAWENVRVGFEGRLRLNRKDFGVMGTAFWNSEFDPGRFAVADSVDIELQVSAQQFNFERRSAPMSDT